MEAAKTVYVEKNILPELGFKIEFVTMKHNSPSHWHQELELLFILNGSAVITAGGERYRVEPLDFTVIDSSVVHEAVYRLPQTMGICIHISKAYLRRYLADIDFLNYSCIPGRLHAGQKASYSRICAYLKDLTILYFKESPGCAFRNAAAIMSIMAELTDFFAARYSEGSPAADADQLARVRQMFQYVEDHYREPISLKSAADVLGLNREYFCRFFKRSTGISFLQYVNQVRLNHIYRELLYSEGSIQEILEANGVSGSRAFYSLFKKTYGCTPGGLRKMGRENRYLL